MRVLALVAACLAAGPAVADQGELQMAAAVALEATTIQHPLAQKGWPNALVAPFSLVPRLGVDAQYGLTNELQLSLGLDAGGAANVATDRVFLGGRTTTLVTGTYFELAAPAGIAWRVDSGVDASGAILIQLAPMVRLWSATAATDSARRGDDGLPRRLPVEVADSTNLGVRARLQLVFVARLFGAIGLHAGGYVGAAWAGTPSFDVGVLFAPSWISAPGLL